MPLQTDTQCKPQSNSSLKSAYDGETSMQQVLFFTALISAFLSSPRPSCFALSACLTQSSLMNWTSGCHGSTWNVISGTRRGWTTCFKLRCMSDSLVIVQCV